MGDAIAALGAAGIKPLAIGSTVLLASGGLNQVGAVGGAIGGFAGLVGTYIALRANARTARREYQEEMAAAEERGRKSMQDTMQPIINNLQDQLTQSRLDAREAREARDSWMRQAQGNPGGH